MHFRDKNDHWLAFLKTSIFGPFEKEILFRLILVTNSPFLRIAVILGWVEYFTPKYFSLSLFDPTYNAVILTILLAIIISKKMSKQVFVNIFKRDYYNYTCLGLVLVFALVHIGNFKPINWSLVYIYPIYVLPQFVYGIMFSYIAIRYNSIIWPFLLHAAINSTAELARLLKTIF